MNQLTFTVPVDPAVAKAGPDTVRLPGHTPHHGDDHLAHAAHDLLRGLRDGLESRGAESIELNARHAIVKARGHGRHVRCGAGG